MRITVRCREAKHTVDATHAGLHGLAWHKSINEKGYTISHVASGYSVIRGIRSKNRLRLAIYVLSALAIDWSMSRTRLEKKCRIHMPKIKEIREQFGQ